MRRYNTKIKVDEIKDMYTSGKNVQDICKELNICEGTAYRKLKQAGVQTIGRAGYANLRISNDVIKSMYLSGMSAGNISKSVGLTISKVTNRLRKMGVDFKPKSNRKYFCDESFFEKFTIESCYWAGFIAADGCVYNGSLSINLKLDDIDHLYKLKEVLKFTGNVETTSAKKPSCLMRINSKKLINDLNNNFNIISKKSLVLKPPVFLPNEMVRHFIRGFLDGDGCYYISDNGGQCSISVTGTYEMLFWVKEYLKENAKIKEKKIPQISKKNSFNLYVGGGIQCRNIIKLLYNNINDTIVLNRKYIKAMLFFDKIKNKSNDEKVVIDLYNEGFTIKYITLNTPFKYRRVSRILIEAGISIRNAHKAKMDMDKQSEILELRNLGFTIKEISKKMKISNTRVSEFLCPNKAENIL